MASKSPRRRQMVWAPTTLGDEESTRIDDHPPWDVVAQAPQLNPSRLTIEVPSLVQRPSPIPMAPLPRRAGQATPPPPFAAQPAPNMYVPRMDAPMDRAAVMPAPLSPGHFYSYAETCQQQQLDTTAPVAPLPFAELATNSFPRQVSRWSRIAMPIGGAVAMVIFVTAFFATRDDRPELPPISSVSRAETPIQLAAAPASAAEIPADSHWKPRTVVPTIAAEAPREEAPAEIPQAVAEVRQEIVEAPAVEPAAPEIEMAPIATEPPAKRTHTSTSRSKSTAKSQRVAAKAPRQDDPVLAEIAKPVRADQPKATGPGKAVVSSDIPSLVYIDGRSTSLKTPTTINLKPGAHRITLVAVSTRKAKTVDIEIKAGASVPVHREFGTASSSSSSKTSPSGKKRIKVDSSTALGGLRPGKAW